MFGVFIYLISSFLSYTVVVVCYENSNNDGLVDRDRVRDFCVFLIIVNSILLNFAYH